MIVRDWMTTGTVRALPWGNVQQLGQVSPQVAARERWLFSQLRALSHSIAQHVQLAAATADRVQRARHIDNIVRLRDLFANVAKEFNDLPSGAPPVVMRMLAKLNTWIRGAVSAPLVVVKEGAKEVTEAAGEVLRKILEEGGKTVLPPLLIVGALALGAIALVGHAERTRTYRRYVA